ncbi:nucleotidyltransferase domain-containing protein [Rugosimonospora africana]|uniref:Polymerase nucleotidyl transferase domain-containing protein n=1 Tax=Rugosimonospora africana TaxID=556532 RepID=A0A8J3VSQ1_9ACTN|nr:nucleotidyltransferase domain-containing protein [Rugosimonospora africana]GIH17259.1 hypothetical protein Raf01_54310 [Rugosimonospora africana]
MFTVEDRDRVREGLLSLAAADPAIGAAAVIGSSASGEADRWSDIDLALSVDGPLDAALDRWTGLLYRDFAARHHWDLPVGGTVYRVFLLPGWLEVDLAFAPAGEFGPRGPHWRVVYTRAQDGEAPAPVARHEPAARREAAAPQEPPTGREPTARQEPARQESARHESTAVSERDRLAGLAWHHALHARVSIERRRAFQAEHWVGALRTQVIALACLRLGHPTAYAKGAHLLPAELTAPLEATLVRSLDEKELRRALGAALAALATEMRSSDPALAERLAPMLTELDSRPAN